MKKTNTTISCTLFKYTIIQKFGVGKIFNVFERRAHQVCNSLIKSTVKMILQLKLFFPVMAEFSAAITPVFRVT